MNIFQLKQPALPARTVSPSFMAAPKHVCNEKVINELSGKILKEATSFGDILDLKSVIDNPKKKKVFFAALSSLLTATALKITELLTDDSSETVTNESGDILEIKTVQKESVKKEPKEKPVKFIKHSGTGTQAEKTLESAIKSVISKFKPDSALQNGLIGLYNNLAGLNYKGVSYNEQNEEFTNANLAVSLAAKLNPAESLDEIHNIISEYSNYSKEKTISEVVQEVPVVPEEPKEEILVPESIQTKKNLKEVYQGLDALDRELTDKFLDSLKEIEDTTLIQNALKKLNKNFPEALSLIAKVADGKDITNTDEKLELLRCMANGFISKEALGKWLTDSDIQRLTFLEYNSLVYKNVPPENIDVLAKMKRDCNINYINLDYCNDNFTLSAPKVFIAEGLNTIHSVFQLLHSDTQTLNGYEKEYSTKDISNEVLQNRESYPNLINYLAMEKKSGLNLGKMTALLKIYQGADINKDFFTLHSYLRFMERYVLPELNAGNKYISTALVKNTYIEQVMSLKNALSDFLRKPVEVFEYSIEEANIKAPKIFVPIGSSGRNYEITINSHGKIHTIF